MHQSQKLWVVEDAEPGVLPAVKPDMCTVSTDLPTSCSHPFRSPFCEQDGPSPMRALVTLP